MWPYGASYRQSDTRKRTRETRAKVREVIRGRCRSEKCSVDGLTAEAALNDHYAGELTSR